MDYGKLLSRSWEIVWNNKFMFVLGFLAALGGSGGGGSNSNFRTGTGSLPPDVMSEIERFWEQFAPLLIGLSCLVLLIGLVLWLVRLVSQAGMISAAARIDAGEKMTFASAFSEGTNKLGRMIGLNLALLGPFLLLALLAGVIFAVTLLGSGAAAFAGADSGSPFDPSAIAAAMGSVALVFACLACLTLPLYAVAMIIYPFAQRGAVLQDMGVIDSIRHGWQMVKNNAGDVILLIILFVALGIVFGLVSGIVLIPFAFLAAGPLLFELINEGTFSIASMATLVVGGLCLGLVGAVVNSIMTAFRSTAVTLAYQQFVNKKSA